MSTATLGLTISRLISEVGGTIYMTERSRRRFLRSVNVTDLEGDVYYKTVCLRVLDDDECIVGGADTHLVLIHE